MQTFSSDSSILNYVHSLLVIVLEKEEEFDVSISNDVVGVQKSNTLYFLEIISDCRSDSFTLLNLQLPKNSYMIACTNTQNFEEGENCASTVSVEHTLGSYMKLFGSNMILFVSYMVLFGSIFKFQYISVMLVVVLINFGVNNQVPKVSFKIIVGELMSVFSHNFIDIIFCEYLDILEIISDCRGDPFTLIYLQLPVNSYMNACTNFQNLEEGDNCASTISVKKLDLFQTLGSDMK